MADKKEKSNEEKTLETYQKISTIKNNFEENPYSDTPRDLLADYQKKNPLEYAAMTTQGLSKLISAEEKNALDSLKTTLTYDWIIQNKNLSEILPLLTTLPLLKDKDKYKKILGLVDLTQKGAQALQNPILTERFVKEYYGKKLEKAKEKKDIANAEKTYATLYAYLSSSNLAKQAVMGIIETERNNLEEELKKAGAKDKKK